MGKKDSKKGKAPFNSAEEAKAKIATLKDEVTAAREERKEFAKANGLSMKSENFEANAKDKKHGKKWTAMTALIDGKKAEIETAEAWLKENKPKKDSTPRETKYEYPAGMSDADKKKFRAQKRAEAAKADKPAKEGKDKKADKKKEGKEGKEGKSDKKSAKPAAEEAPAKEGKKKDKKKAAKNED